tara:strand:- start:3513 stop:3914 length:402 start_codon:yes stop_codon:yes gene_type:complete
MSPIDITRAAASSVALALSLVPDPRVSNFARPVAEIPAMVDRVIRRRGRIRGQARAVGAWVDILDDAIPGVDEVIPEEVRDALITVGVWAATAIGGLVESKDEEDKETPRRDKRSRLTSLPPAVAKLPPKATT